MPGHVERDPRFFDERYGDVARIDGIATIFHLSDRAMAARIDDPYPTNVAIGPTRVRQHFPLPWIDFVFVDVAHFAHDRIELTRLITGAREEDQFPNFEFGRSRSFQAAVHVVGIRNPLLG